MPEIIVVMDCETTGFGYSARVLELGAVKIVNGQIQAEQFHQQFNPPFKETESTKQAEAVHGLTKEILAGKPQFHECVEDFIRFIQDADYIVCHNAFFDVTKIRKELKICEQHFRGKGFFFRHDFPVTEKDPRVIDTLKIARSEYFKDIKQSQGGNKLDHCCAYFGIHPGGRDVRHNAVEDAELTAKVYLAMMNEIIDQPDVISEFTCNLPSSHTQSGPVFHFTQPGTFAPAYKQLQHSPMTTEVSEPKSDNIFSHNGERGKMLLV